MSKHNDYSEADEPTWGEAIAAWITVGMTALILHGLFTLHKISWST